MKELFSATLQPYVSIMVDWINRGELDLKREEFFIKANPKVFERQAANQGGQQNDETPKAGEAGEDGNQ